MKKRLHDSEQSRPFRMKLVIALLGTGLLLDSPFADGGDGDGDGDSGSFGGGETIGSLPSTSGGNGSGSGMYGVGAGMSDNRPVFYLAGPQSEIDQLITHAAAEPGAGYYTYFTVAPGEVLYEFHGDLELELDESVLARGLVEIGVRAGFSSTPMLVSLAWGRTATPPSTVAAGSFLALPFVRMQSANLFATPVSLHTYDETGGRSLFELDSFGGFLTILQDT